MALKSDNQNFGRLGEKCAQEYLTNAGYKIIETNFRTKIGEIDIIATNNDSILFVEVKSRTSNKYGLPVEAITSKKLKTISRVSQYYLYTHHIVKKYVFIKVLAVELSGNIIKSIKMYSVE